ncbi:MAG: protein kinase domain-containing protein [Candidatus Acidiferrales bacterium]
MIPERWQEIKKVLAGALERTPEQRSAYLAEACAEPELRREVESLIAAQEKAGSSFMERPPMGSNEALKSGSKLGPYEIIARLGVGGMGEVYRARDTRLNRTVAIKVLRDHLADRVGVRERFEREARTIASLNHAHICTLHDVGREGGTDYLVMEYVEGETLAARLRKGPLPVEQVLQYSIEIADALDKAHRKGITHRDLKPGNIMLTKSGTKLLDFGLAKLQQEMAPNAQLSQLPTASEPLTAQGTILGTLQYMAPEQLEGKEADARTDIFAFGVVVYEMATGKKAFEGKSQASLIAKILETNPPPISSLQPMTPPALDRLVKKCLAKEPDDRWQSARDLHDELAWIAEGGSQAGVTAPVVARRRSRERMAWALAVAGLLFGTAIAGYFLLQPKNVANVVRFSVLPPAGENFFPYGGYLSLSPDGRKLAFVTGGQLARGVPGQLWVRSLDSLAAQPLPGTEGAVHPFWSPEGQYIGFFTYDGKLAKVPVSGGPPQVLCDANDGGGGTWNRDGVILFSSYSKLYRVSEAGGTPALVAAPDAARQELQYRFPQFLPDGRHFLFFLVTGTESGGYGVAGFYVEAGSLDSTKTERLFLSDSQALYALPGYLFYARQGTLLAQPFDANGLKFAGSAVPLAAGIGLNTTSFGYFSVSETGAVAYQSAAGGVISQMTWYNRNGEKLGTVGQPGLNTSSALSPDGTRLAVGVGERGARDIWIYDLKRGTASRLTANSADNLNPLWSADASRIIFTSTRAGQFDIYEQAADGLGNAEPIYVSKDQAKAVDDLAPDGRYVVYDTLGGAYLTDMWVLPLTGERKPVPFVQGNFAARAARFSPNGRYVAYASTESGRYEIYVQTFPEHLGKWQVSTTGGIEPAWRRDGKELFYLSPDNKVMAVEVNTDSANFQAGIPKPLFQAQLISGFLWRNRYLVSADGQRFLMLTPAGEAAPSAPITVVLNWPADLKP